MNSAMDTATAWSLIITAYVCIIFGVIIVTVSIHGWTWRHRGAAAIAYGLLGLIFLTTPKWKEITFDVMGVKATIAELEKQRDEAVRAKKSLSESINQLASVRMKFAQKGYTGADALRTFQTLEKDFGWIGVLPTKPENFRFDILTKPAEFDSVSAKLGLAPDRLGAILAAQKLQLVRPVESGELGSIPAYNLLIEPVLER